MVDQEIGITSTSKEDNNFKMILTTYILGIALFGVIMFLLIVSMEGQEHDELFLLKFFFIIAGALLVSCFNAFMSVKMQNLEEKKTEEIEEREKTMTGAPENTSIGSGYGTVDKTYQDYIPIPIP